MEAYTNGGSKVNQLGGKYVSGKPLPPELRSRIITLSCLGLRQCDISRQLKVTHGCISKLLSKYQESGNLNAAQNTGRPRVITADIEKKIDQYRRQDPGAFCWELRDYLLRDSVCPEDQIPSLSSISRLIKNKIIHEAVEKRERDENITSVKKQNTPTPFSISNILSISNDGNKNQQHVHRPCGANRTLYSDIGGKNLPARDRITPALQRDSQGYGTLRTQRRMRTRFNRSQSAELEREFLRNPYLGVQGRITLADKLEIDESRIQIWFANRRARGRRQVNTENGPLSASSGDKQLTYSRDNKLPIVPKWPLLYPSVTLSPRKNARMPFYSPYQ